MNTILFPTDFSNNALNALDYALDLANTFESKLVMIHAVNITSKVGTLQVLERKMVEDGEKELNNWIKRAKNKLHRPDALLAKVVKGNIIGKIDAISKQVGADFIVISAKGEGDKDDKYLGKITASVIKSINIPTLIIPFTYRFKPIKNIIFSVKYKRVASAEVVKPLKEIATKFEASVVLVHVKTPDYDPSRGENLFLDDLPYKPYTMEGEFIYNVTLAFIKNHPIDMLVAIRRKRGFFKNIVFENGTKKKTFNSNVPFLVLQGKK